MENERVQQIVAEWGREIDRRFDSLSPKDRLTAYRLLICRLQSKIPPRDWFEREIIAYLPVGAPDAAIEAGVGAACRHYAETEDQWAALAAGRDSAAASVVAPA